MTHSRKRARVAAAAVTAVMAMASVFALASPASAEAVHPDPARNATASGGELKINVDWDAPDTGEPATSYVLVIRDVNGNQVGDPVIVLAPTTQASLDAPAGQYYVEIFTHNAYPGFGGPTRAPGVGTVTVTNPVQQPVAPPVVNTLPYRPYANWSDMIDQEYQLFTGCGKLGRLPRDDEKTFWLYNIANRPWDGTDQWNFNNFQFYRQRAEWIRLTNGATFSAFDDPGTVQDDRFITSPGYENSIAYKTLYDKEYKNLTSIPSGGGFAPADQAGNGGNQNNLLEPNEITWAQNAAKNFAKWGPELIAEFGSKVNALAADQARNDVYFARRAIFKTQLAEDAEQTDGPSYRLYTAYFSRIPDFGGLCFWSNKLRNGWSLLDISDFFVKSSEFRNTYGEYSTYGEEGATDAAEFVALVYKNVLNRTPDGAGVSFWTRQLQTERYSPAEMMIGFSESQEFKNKMASKVGIGIGFAHLLGRMPSESEYVAAEYNYTYFQTSPTNGWYGWPDNDDLYWTIVDSAEYLARAAL